MAGFEKNTLLKSAQHSPRKGRLRLAAGAVLPPFQPQKGCFKYTEAAKNKDRKSQTLWGYEEFREGEKSSFPELQSSLPDK